VRSVFPLMSSANSSSGRCRWTASARLSGQSAGLLELAIDRQSGFSSARRGADVHPGCEIVGRNRGRAVRRSARIPPTADARERSQSLASGGLPAIRRCSETSRAAELEGSEILLSVPIRHVRIQRFHSASSNRSPSETLRSFARSRRWAHSSLGSPLPLDFRLLQRPRISVRTHPPSGPVLRVVLGEVLPKPLEELRFRLLGFPGKAHEGQWPCSYWSQSSRRNRSPGWRRWREGRRCTRSGLARGSVRICLDRFPAVAWCFCSMRHLESVCLNMPQFRNARESSLASRISSPRRIRVTLGDLRVRRLGSSSLALNSRLDGDLNEAAGAAAGRPSWTLAIGWSQEILLTILMSGCEKSSYAQLRYHHITRPEGRRAFP